MKWFRWFMALMIPFACVTIEIADGIADIVRVKSSWVQDGMTQYGYGTAVCLGFADNPAASLFVTAKHNLSGGSEYLCVDLGDGYGYRQCDRVIMHPTEDLATFELHGIRLKGWPIATGLRESTPVLVCGFGPEYHCLPDADCFRGVLGDAERIGSRVIGENWKHPVTGDSGGAVIAKGERGLVLTGIVSGYFGSPVEVRDDVMGDRPETVCVSASVIQDWVETQYGSCPTCPIQVHPEIRQPMMGIGIPVGPPRVIGVASPAQRQYVPVPQQVERPRYREPVQEREPDSRRNQIVEQRVINEEVVDEAVERYFQKHPVRNGRDGEPGRDGKDGADGKTPSTDKVVQIVDAIMDAQPERFRGRDGQNGKDGRDSPPVDINAVAEAIVKKHSDQLRGPQGIPGQIGVLDDADMRSMVRGWLSDPETRAWLVKDLGQDMQVQSLIRRLEALEKSSSVPQESASAPKAAVSRLVLVRAGADSQIDALLAKAKVRFSEIIEVSKDEIPKNVIVRSYPTMIAFSPTGSVAGMWESSTEVSNQLSMISYGRYP